MSSPGDLRETRVKEALRVLFVEASTGGVVGGSLTGLYHLMRGMDRRSFFPMMALYETKDIEADLQSIGVPVYHIHRPRVPKEHSLLNLEGYQRAKAASGVRRTLRLGRQALRLAAEEIPAALRLARLIRKTGADVVHLGNGARANFDGLIACWLTGTASLCHVKGFEKFSRRERWTSRYIDAVVCMTHAIEEHCEKHGITGRSRHVIYDALDETAFAPQRDPAAVRAELGIANGALCVGVVGNIQEWKGQAVLVEAMAEVVRAVPQARGLIIGGVHRAGAAYGDRLQKQIHELNLNRVLSITGFRRDVADVMNALDVIVHTSVRAEPFGRVILEGMFLGKPVVASAAGGVPELIDEGHTGFLVPPREPQPLADRLIRLLRDGELRRSIGTQAQAWARDKFALERHVAAMTTLYETIARRH
jgi:glycosyltransferase involved in cell wall biosynthesis